MDAESYEADTGLIGFLIIGSCLGFGVVFCLGICLVSWLRKKRREKNKNLLPLNVKCIQKQRKSNKPSFSPHQQPGILFFPSISNSEPGSDAGSQKSTLSATSPLTTDRTKSFKTFTDPQGTSQETQRESLTNSSFWRDKIPFCDSSASGNLRGDTVRRRTLSSPNLTPRFQPATFPQTWAGPKSVKVTQQPIDMSAPVSSSCFPFDQNSRRDRIVHFMEDTSKYKIGQIRLRIKYSQRRGQLFVGLFQQIDLPSIMNIQFADMFAKFSLLSKDLRVKKVMSLPTTTQRSPFSAVFFCNVNFDTFLSATLGVSLCKKGDYSSQRVVVGAASIPLRGFTTSMNGEGNITKDLDADLLEASNRHKVDCDGVLSFDVSYDTCSNSVLLLNVIFQEFEARKISKENNNRQYSEIYLKAMAYKGSNALCWRRGSSVFIEPTDSSVSLASLLCLPTSTSDFADITLVLMIKQKFTTRGRRNLLGKLLLNLDSLLVDETVRQKAATGKFWKKSVKLTLDN